MAKKRTGLQSEIAGIFSGVPVPKKGSPRSKSDSQVPKPSDPASKPGGAVIPKPVAPQPQVPVAPTPQEPVEPSPAAARPKVAEVKVPEIKTRQKPKKIPRRRKDKLFAPKASVSSSRQKTGIILFVLLSMALVIVLARPYYTSRRNTTSRNARPENAVTSTMANIKIDWPVPPVYSETLRDPMELGSRRQMRIETTNGLVVRGISYSEDRKYAVIGTQTVQEGDVIRGTTIVEISPNSVVFEKDGKKWSQEVQGEE